MRKTLHFEQAAENAYVVFSNHAAAATTATLPELHILLRLQVAPSSPVGSPGAAPRPALNLSVVLDRSGSMSGDKLAYAKKATEFVVRHVSERDALSVVTYDSGVDVIAEGKRNPNKDALARKVAAVREGGCTNLSGGLLEGYSQVKRVMDSTNAAQRIAGQVNRVLLLSDGLANEGITDKEKLREIAQKHFREQHISLSTFGLGEGFDEHLMTSLAEYGGANYYFIANPDEIPSIFAKELSGLLSVAAQNATVTLKFPAEYFECVKTFGYVHHEENGAVVIKFGDVVSEERKTVLIKFRVRKSLPKEQVSLAVTWSYDDVSSTNVARIVETYYVNVRGTEDIELAKMSQNKEVHENVVQLVANDTLQDIMRLPDEGKFEEAKKRVGELRQCIVGNMALHPESELLRKQIENVQAYEATLPQLQEMSHKDKAKYSTVQKAMRAVAYSASKQH